jgi:histidinol-phosphatase
MTTVQFLQQLADLADGIAMPRFEAQDFVIETKPDHTEVTLADRNTEEALTAAILAAYPDHHVLGEEFGAKGNSDSRWRWIIDPIDGTSNFTRGVPIWATLIAAEHDGVLQAAMVSCPALNRRWWAVRGSGAFLNGKQIRVSKVSALSNAFISYSFGHWTDETQLANLRDLLSQCTRERCFGDFWQHMMVAEGSIDLAVEPIVSHWDLAAIQLIVEEAGGRFTNIAGEARADGGSAVSTNGLLHEQVVATLNHAPQNVGN